MTEDRRSDLFKLDMANMMTALKMFNQKGLLSHVEHFRLWQRLLRAETQNDLSALCREVSDLVDKRKRGVGK